MTTIPIYIGTEPSQWLPTQVLMHSVRARTARAVEFIPLQGEGFGLSMYTGFSFYRWMIPAANGFQERAIYLDADIVVLGDIGELYDIEMSKPVMAKAYQNDFFTSVMVLDCPRLRHWDFDAWVVAARANKLLYDRMMWARPGAPNHGDIEPMPGCWNDLDIVKSTSRLVHYTDLARQPWRHSGHREGETWRRELHAAISDGSISLADVRREIERKTVREDLLTVV